MSKQAAWRAAKSKLVSQYKVVQRVRHFEQVVGSFYYYCNLFLYISLRCSGFTLDGRKLEKKVFQVQVLIGDGILLKL